MEIFRKTSIGYDKRLKRWQASNGNGVYYADANRHKVLLHALRHDNPPIYRVVKTMCCAVSRDANGNGIPKTFVERILKAADLVTGSRVNLLDMRVYSQSREHTSYAVSFEGIPKKWDCGCPDFAKGAVNTIPYGRVCKHCLAVMILRSLGGYAPHPNAYEAQEDFLQSMSEREARRMHDPDYAEALTHGDEGVFWYVYHEILSEFSRQLFQHTQEVLRITDDLNAWQQLQSGRLSERAKGITDCGIRDMNCNGTRFYELFEIPELEGEDYGFWWEQLWQHAHNGQLGRLKSELIEAFDGLGTRN